MLTGVGGQGIQLTAKTLAMAAVDEGRQAMLLGHYAGSMRGGQTDASIVVADGRLRTLPDPARPPGRPSSCTPTTGPTPGRSCATAAVVVANSSLVEDDLGRPDCQVFMIPAERYGDRAWVRP